MKYIVTESQLKLLLEQDRTQGLMNKYVLNDTTKENYDDWDSEEINGRSGIIAYELSKKSNVNKKMFKISDLTFEALANADPTSNKTYLEWLCSTFLKLLKEGDIEEAITYIEEDLEATYDTLVVFDRVKIKNTFKRNARITDYNGNIVNKPVGDISSYDNPGQLQRVIQPFDVEEEETVETEPSKVKPTFSKSGKEIKDYLTLYKQLDQAKIVYHDDKVLIYVPNTYESTCDLSQKLGVKWCTSLNRGHFTNYRSTDRKPNGELSDYFIVIPYSLLYNENPKTDSPNNQLSGSRFYPLQIHFESGQIRDKYQEGHKNITDSDINKFISDYPGAANYLLKEVGELYKLDIINGSGLMESKYFKYIEMFGGNVKNLVPDSVYQEGIENIRRLASAERGPIKDNKYIKWLLDNVGGTVTDFLDPTSRITSLDLSGFNLSVFPDLSEYKTVFNLTINNCNLNELPDYRLIPPRIASIVANNNNIKIVPIPGYENLDDLISMMLTGNPIQEINVDVLNKAPMGNISISDNSSNREKFSTIQKIKYK
jgi:hypothetical protein